MTALPVFIAALFRVDGTKAHPHLDQARGYLESHGTHATVVTPFSWGRYLTYAVFSPRLILRRLSPPAGVVWHRYWHSVFLYRALRRVLAHTDECVVYAQGPLEARAALRARRGPQQRVIMAVHFHSSQADEHAGREIKRDGKLYLSIQWLERDVILKVAGLVYVPKGAREALLAWFPEAGSVPCVIMGNAVQSASAAEQVEPPADLAELEAFLLGAGSKA